MVIHIGNILEIRSNLGALMKMLSDETFNFSYVPEQRLYIKCNLVQYLNNVFKFRAVWYISSKVRLSKARYPNTLLLVPNKISKLSATKTNFEGGKKGIIKIGFTHILYGLKSHLKYSNLVKMKPDKMLF